MLQENIIDKTEKLIKEKQSYKSIVCIVCNSLLNSHRFSSSFVSSGISSQILGPKNLISVPLKTVRTGGM